MQTSLPSGLRASPVGENFAPTSPKTAQDFLRQNANILSDAYFERQIASIRQKLEEWHQQRNPIQKRLVDYMDCHLAKSEPGEEVDPLLDSYVFVLDILDDGISILTAVIDLCTWIGRFYTERLNKYLQREADAWAELEHLRLECRRLREDNQRFHRVLLDLKADNLHLAQRVETADEALLTLAKRILTP